MRLALVGEFTPRSSRKILRLSMTELGERQALLAPKVLGPLDTHDQESGSHMQGSFHPNLGSGLSALRLGISIPPK